MKTESVPIDKQERDIEMAITSNGEFIKHLGPPNACRCCGEPLKAAAATGCLHKSFAIQPQGWGGPLIVSLPPKGSSCGLTGSHGGSALDIGFNLTLKDGVIIQNPGGCLTAEQWDHLMGGLLKLAEESGLEFPWFRALLKHTQLKPCNPSSGGV